MVRRCLAIGVVAVLAMAVCVLPSIAMAAETINATPMFDVAMNGLEAGLLAVSTVVVGWVGLFAKRFFGAEVAARTQATVETALKNGVSLIMAEARRRGTPLAQISVDNPMVAIGANYVLAQVPKALASLKIGRGELLMKLVARLPHAPAA